MTSAARNAWNEAMKATAGVSALPPALQGRRQKRRSDRHKKQERRTKARKISALTEENAEIRAAVWMDALEGVDPNVQVDDDDEEFDELEDLEDKKKKRRSSTSKKKEVGVLPKRFLPRTLASILIEEAGREDGSARAFLDAEARLKPEQQLPARKFCPVTGLIGLYTEPKTRIPYASLKALEQIRERPPPWLTLTGSAAYAEAVGSIRDDK
jgi:hypothetical protein